MITKKRTSFQAIFLLIFLALSAIGVIGLLVFTNLEIKQKRVELREKIEVLKKETQALEKKIANLRAGISQTESEEYQIEQLYKQGYFKEGEIPVVVLPPEEKKEEKVSGEKDFWNPQTWWEWLKGKLGE